MIWFTKHSCECNNMKYGSDFNAKKITENLMQNQTKKHINIQKIPKNYNISLV